LGKHRQGAWNSKTIFPKVSARYDQIFGIDLSFFFWPAHAIDRKLMPEMWEPRAAYPFPEPVSDPESSAASSQ